MKSQQRLIQAILISPQPAITDLLSRDLQNTDLQSRAEARQKL